MKKLLGCFLCVMLLVFGIAFSAQAVPIDPTGTTPTFTPPQHALPYIDGTVWTTWSTGYLGGTADLYLAGWTQPQQPGQDTIPNVNYILQTLNGLDPITDSTPHILGSGNSGLLDVSGYELVSLKWNGVFGVWDVSGIDSFDFSGLRWGLSHYTLYNSVPEPATMLLFGTGILCLGVFGRKRFKQ